jgi:hypothetical protein
LAALTRTNLAYAMALVEILHEAGLVKSEQFAMVAKRMTPLVSAIWQQAVANMEAQNGTTEEGGGSGSAGGSREDSH